MKDMMRAVVVVDGVNKRKTGRRQRQNPRLRIDET